jgi:hypothetical protein
MKKASNLIIDNNKVSFEKEPGEEETGRKLCTATKA